MDKVQVFALIVSTGLLLGVLELVRRGRLKESYSVLWICTALVVMFFAVFRHMIDWLGQFVGIYYTPSAFFLMAFMFLTLITVQFSVVISKLSQRNKALTQEVALIKLRLEEVESKLAK